MSVEPTAGMPSIVVAIVDDDESVRIAVRRLCEALGLTTAVYASGRAFTDSLSVSYPDCVLLDAHMPEMSGLEVQRTLVNRGVRLPTVIISGEDPDALGRFNAGSVEYLRKPFGSDDLLAAIGRALRVLMPNRPSTP